LELELSVTSRAIHAGAANEDVALNKLLSILDVRYCFSSCEPHLVTLWFW
jgi:hypothetical protein